MKRIIALVLALVMMTACFVACAKDNQNEGQPDAQETTGKENGGKEEGEKVYEVPAQEYFYDRVVILGVDGCGAFFTDTDTPNFDRIFADGAVTYNMQAVMPSSSAPNWGAMLHGVDPEYHNLTNDVAETYEYPINSAFPSVFRLVREAYPDATLASFSTWEPINHGIIEANLGVHKETADNDEQLTGKILSYLSENDPKLLFVQLDECDSAGHGSGYGEEEFLTKLRELDGYIGQIYDLYQEKGRGEKLLFIVTGDHSGTVTGMHGGDTDEELNITFAAKGGSVINGGVPSSISINGKTEDMSIRDVAAVVLRAFGLEQPETMTGMVPNNLFTDYASEAPRNKYKVEYKYEHRTHYSEATPKEGSGKHITDVFGDKVAIYLPFDSSIVEATGIETVEYGNVNYISGYYGKAASMKNGSMQVEEFWPSDDSFTIAFWFQSASSTSDPTIFANKNRSFEANAGIALAFQPGSLMLNFADGEEYINETFYLPPDHHKGWVHVIISIDRNAGTIGVSYDFEDFTVVEIPESMKDADLDGMGTLSVGQDTTRSHGEELTTPIDEFIVFDGKFTADDVAALAEYYGIK